MDSSAAQLAVAGYALGTLGFGAFAAQLIVRRSKTPIARRLLAAILAGLLWEIAGLSVSVHPAGWTWIAYSLTDALRYVTWLGLLVFVLPTSRSSSAADGASSMLRWVPSFLGAALLLVIIGPELSSLLAPPSRSALPPALVPGLWLVASICGLVFCEQLFRSTPDARRWAIKPLCIGLGAAFAFDLFMFSDALLLQGVDVELWSARGLVHALTLPLLLVATARNRDWTVNVAVSRGIVFGSTALLLSGLYLLTVAGAGYFVRVFGGEWGRTIQIAFLFAAVLTLVVVFASGSVRARLRVFVNKNFFSYRYDYRQEWLRFTQTLSTIAEEQDGTHERAIRGLANLVESPSGVLWWRDDNGAFRQVGRWNVLPIDDIEASDGPFATFLGRTGWVVDLMDARRRPDGYEDFQVPTWVDRIPQAWLVVPMMGHDGLTGFTILTQPRTTVDLNWEVLDLLKTASRQATAFLGHVHATEALVQSRQFEAFNRMSAFLVHDLKNLVAQQSLLLKNAERHAGNPEFQRDMLDTVRHVVERMNRLLLQLRSGTAPVANPTLVHVQTVLERLRAYHESRSQTVVVDSPPDLRVLAHEERLERVLGHLIQNGFESMDGAGTIRVRVRESAGRTTIEVEDQGKGMTPEFIRDGLFKPFVSTKATGMGIGAYESREYVTELGGGMDVDSTPDQGTTMRLWLPLGRDPAATQARHAA